MDKNSVMKWCIACDRTQQHDIVFHKNKIPILKCCGCGLGSADASDFDPSSYYDKGYFSGDRVDGYEDYQASEKVLRAEFQRTLNAMRTMGVGSGALLELGCAYGYFLMEARKYFDVYGIEICEDAVETCRKNGLQNVRCGSGVDELGAVPQVDAVVMLDVIEHLKEPAVMMAEAVSKIRHDGILLMTTGDFSSMVSRVFVKRWRLMTPPQHLWFFTPKALELMGNRLGLELVSVEHPSKKVPLSLMLYQMCRPFNYQLKPHPFLGSIGLTINTFDAMRLIFRKNKV